MTSIELSPPPKQSRHQIIRNQSGNQSRQKYSDKKPTNYVSPDLLIAKAHPGYHFFDPGMMLFVDLVGTVNPITAIIHRTASIDAYLLVVFFPEEQIFSKPGTHCRQKRGNRTNNRKDRIQKSVGDSNGIHPGFRCGNKKGGSGSFIRPLLAE